MPDLTHLNLVSGFVVDVCWGEGRLEARTEDGVGRRKGGGGGEEEGRVRNSK